MLLPIFSYQRNAALNTYVAVPQHDVQGFVWAVYLGVQSLDRANVHLHLY